MSLVPTAGGGSISASAVTEFYVDGCQPRQIYESAAVDSSRGQFGFVRKTDGFAVVLGLVGHAEWVRNGELGAERRLDLDHIDICGEQCLAVGVHRRIGEHAAEHAHDRGVLILG